MSCGRPHPFPFSPAFQQSSGKRQMGAGDGDAAAAAGGGGHPHQYHYQALPATVQNPNRSLHPFPFPAGPGGDASQPSAAPHSQTPSGFSNWSTSNSAFASLTAQSAPATINPPFNYNLSPSYALWTPYMLNKNVAYSYLAPTEEYAHTLRHTHNQDKESGSAPSLGVESFTTMSLGPNICTQRSPMEGSIYTKEAKNSEDFPAVVRSSDEMEVRNSGEFHRDGTLPESKQVHGSCNTKANSGEYQVILRKELTRSDVANVGRVVLPKKDAEASLPPLVQGDHLTLQMDDMVLPITWKFKYRFWPNNKSRMYILEAAGEFVKTHGLQAGDVLIIYKSSVSGKFIIRGEKAIQQATNS